MVAIVTPAAANQGIAPATNMKCEAAGGSRRLGFDGFRGHDGAVRSATRRNCRGKGVASGGAVLVGLGGGGGAVRGGIGLSLSCHPTRKCHVRHFGAPRESGLGVAGGLTGRPRQIGLKRSHGHELTARECAPRAEGRELGFVNEVVCRQGEPWLRRERWAETICKTVPNVETRVETDHPEGSAGLARTAIAEARVPRGKSDGGVVRDCRRAKGRAEKRPPKGRGSSVLITPP